MDRQHVLLLLSLMAVALAVVVFLRLQRGRSRGLEAAVPSSPLAVLVAGRAGCSTFGRRAEPVAKSAAIVLRSPRALEHATAATRFPLVLVHGMFGFEAVRLGGQQHQYFRGIRARLEELGNRVHVVRLPVAAGIRTSRSGAGAPGGGAWVSVA